MISAPTKLSRRTAEPSARRFAAETATPHDLHAEGPAVAVVPASPAMGIRGASLATLLAGHILQDGEVVLMILKPSLWFIVISSLRFGAVALILLIAAFIFRNPSPSQSFAYVEAALIILAARGMWAALQWMGRFYILTDLRIIRLGGVFSLELSDCPLRKVIRTRLQFSTCERLVRTGSIEVARQEECALMPATWQTVASPHAVHDQIVAAINRAKQGGQGGLGSGFAA